MRSDGCGQRTHLRWGQGPRHRPAAATHALPSETRRLLSAGREEEKQSRLGLSDAEAQTGRCPAPRSSRGPGRLLSLRSACFQPHRLCPKLPKLSPGAASTNTGRHRQPHGALRASRPGSKPPPRAPRSAPSSLPGRPRHRCRVVPASLAWRSGPDPTGPQSHRRHHAEAAKGPRRSPHRPYRAPKNAGAEGASRVESSPLRGAVPGCATSVRAAVNQPDFIQTKSAQASATTSRFKGHVARASGPAAQEVAGGGEDWEPWQRCVPPVGLGAAVAVKPPVARPQAALIVAGLHRGDGARKETSPDISVALRPQVAAAVPGTARLEGELRPVWA